MVGMERPVDFAGMAVHDGKLHAGGLVVVEISEVFLGFVFEFFRIVGYALREGGEIAARHEEILVNPDVAPFGGFVGVGLGQREGVEAPAGGGIEDDAASALQHVGGVEGGDKVGAAGVGAGDVLLILADCKVGLVVVHAEGAQVVEVRFPQRAPGVDVARVQAVHAFDE